MMTNETNDALEESFVTSRSKRPGRRVWTLFPDSDRLSWAVIFLDAELYIERVKAVSVLRQIQAVRHIPPLLAVFVSSESVDARHADYTCDPDYGTFLSQDVVPWLLDRYNQVDCDRIMIAGLSLSGLAAAYATITYPNRFRAAICQSPSFWWDDERFGSLLPQGGGARPAFWVSVGSEETERCISHAPSGLFQMSSQIEACQRGCDALKNAKYSVNYRIFRGGHDPERWREDLGLALSWVAKL